MQGLILGAVTERLGDARALPASRLADGVSIHGCDPLAIARETGLPANLVISRLSRAPVEVTGAPVGLVGGDAARPVMAHAVAARHCPHGPDGAVVACATVCVVSNDAAASGAGPPRAVGQACPILPRPDCPARTAPSILPSEPA